MKNREPGRRWVSRTDVLVDWVEDLMIRGEKKHTKQEEASLALFSISR